MPAYGTYRICRRLATDTTGEVRTFSPVRCRSNMHASFGLTTVRCPSSFNKFFKAIFREVGSLYSEKLFNTSPVFYTPYPVPLVHQQVFKQELEHLIQEKVLQRISRSEWAFPTFLIPKKDGRVRWISDFRRLNKLLKRTRYCLPNIPAIIQKRAGFKFITSLTSQWVFILL